MSYSTAALENDIRARALALADVLAASHPSFAPYQKVRQEFQSEVAAASLPPDQMTWFAIGRVAARLGLPAVRLEQAGTPVPAGALVMVDPALPAPESPAHDTIRALRAASCVVAPASWGQVLRHSGLAGVCVDDAPKPAPAPGDSSASRYLPFR